MTTLGRRSKTRPVATLALAGNVHTALSQVAPILVTANAESKQARLRAWDMAG